MSVDLATQKTKLSLTCRGMKKLGFKTLIVFALLTVQDAIASEQWIQRANFGGAARHRCVGFSIGNKGYIGGGHINSGSSYYHEDFWQYDPSSDSWTQIADFGGGKRYHSTAFTIGGIAYVGLGEDDADAYHNDFYRYIPEFNLWQPIASYPGNPRRGATSFVIDGWGYVGTGQSDFGYEDDFYRYNPEDDQWYVITNFLGEARSSAVGFSYNGKGYVGTGHIWGNHTKDFYEYDPFTNSWMQKADVGPTFRQDATGFVIGDYGYIGTGNDVDGNLNYEDFWQYNFETDTWLQIEDFSGQGRRYMVSFTIGDIAFAGTGTDGTNLRDFWMFNPILGEQEKSISQLNIYPNPTTDQLTLSGSSAGDEVEIYSLQGQLVYTHQITSTEEVIDLSNFSKGNYCLHILHPDMTRQSTYFVKE